MVNLVKWWRESPWYGFIYGEHDNGWIFSLLHRWQFSVPVEALVGGVWLYDSTLGVFLWTRDDLYGSDDGNTFERLFWSPTGSRWIQLQSNSDNAPNRTWLDFSDNTVKTDLQLTSELSVL